MMRRLLLSLFALLGAPAIALAQDNVLPDLSGVGSGDGDLSSPVNIVLVLTALALAPAILMTVTAFTRIVIVLSFVRKALSVQDMPPNQVVIGLALFLTIVAMNPTLTEIYEQAAKPYMEDEIGFAVASERALDSLHVFMRQHTHEDEIELFLELTETPPPETPEQVPITVMIPAFALSEVKIAFKMGFLIYIPFLVVDIVIASILLAMGMFMLPPVIISTPFKILLFVMVDGWTLVIGSLMQSFQVPL
ncbi:MAG: flagellar type III secretion system pore protein FliP [Planctomycetota bacterium]